LKGLSRSIQLIHLDQVWVD